MGSARLSQSQETVRSFNLYQKVNILFYIQCTPSTFNFHFFTVGNYIGMYRLIVTDNAQCGAWASWCAANKRSRNARTSHSQNPSFSDAVQFFLHIINTDAYSEFNMKASLYSHFQQLLGTPVKSRFFEWTTTLQQK